MGPKKTKSNKNIVNESEETSSAKEDTVEINLNIIHEDYKKIKEENKELNKKINELEMRFNDRFDSFKKNTDDIITGLSEYTTTNLNKMNKSLNEKTQEIKEQIQKMKEENDKKTERERQNIEVLKYHNNYINNIKNEMNKQKKIDENRFLNEIIVSDRNLILKHESFIFKLINELTKDHNYLKLQDDNLKTPTIHEQPDETPQCKQS